MTYKYQIFYDTLATEIEKIRGIDLVKYEELADGAVKIEAKTIMGDIVSTIKAGALDAPLGFPEGVNFQEMSALIFLKKLCEQVINESNRMSYGPSVREEQAPKKRKKR